LTPDWLSQYSAAGLRLTKHPLPPYTLSAEEAASLQKAREVIDT
jgi:hypothetical protein